MGAIEDANIVKDMEVRFKASLDDLSEKLSSVRTGRANAKMLDRVFVNYFDVQTPLNQLGSVTVQQQSLTVDPYDKTAIKAIERALVESDVGLTPSSDGNKIRLNVPPLTEETRKSLVKVAKGIAEDSKVAVRNIRRDSVDAVKKLAKDKTKGVAEDNVKDAEQAIQKLTDATVKKVDDAVKAKEKDILTV